MTEWEIYFPSSTDRWKALPVNNVSRNMFPGVCRRKIVPELLWYSKVYFNLIHKLQILLLFWIHSLMY